MSLIEEVFSSENPGALRTLWEDQASRLLLLEKIGKVMYAHPEKIFYTDPTNQLIAILSQAQFPHKSEEFIQVTGLITRTIYLDSEQPDILPNFAQYHKTLDKIGNKNSRNANQISSVRKKFGASCLISLVFFYKALKKREKAGYPSPTWYRLQGKTALYLAEMGDVTYNFEKWEAYLSDKLN